MTVTVRIPTPLRRFSGDASSLDIDAATVAEAIAALPGVRERVLDEQGALRRHVNVFVNGDSVRTLDGVDTKLRDGDEVSILPAVSGGSAT